MSKSTSWRPTGGEPVGLWITPAVAHCLDILKPTHGPSQRAIYAAAVTALYAAAGSGEATTTDAMLAELCATWRQGRASITAFALLWLAIEQRRNK